MTTRYPCLVLALAFATTLGHATECDHPDTRNWYESIPYAMPFAFGSASVRDLRGRGATAFDRTWIPRFMSARALRPVQLASHTEHGTWLIVQRGAPSITVRVEAGAYDGLAATACALEVLRDALAGVPALVVKSLPSDTVIALERVHEVGRWGASKDVRGHVVSTHPASIFGRSLGYEPFSPETCPRLVGALSNLEEILIHEFAHIIDYRFGLTLSGRGEHNDWWADVQTKGRPRSSGGPFDPYRKSFVSYHAAENRHENLAETFTAWLAYRTGKLDADYHGRTEYADVVLSRMCRELAWWDAHALRAAASSDGALWFPQPHERNQAEAETLHRPDDFGF